MAKFSSDNFAAAERDWEAMNSDPPDDGDEPVMRNRPQRTDDESFDPYDDPGYYMDRFYGE